MYIEKTSIREMRKCLCTGWAVSDREIVWSLAYADNLEAGTRKKDECDGRQDNEEKNRRINKDPDERRTN